MNYKNNEYRALAEWERQSFVQLTWPHEDTDWNYILDDAVRTFCDIAKAIIRFEKLVIVCQDEAEVRRQLGDVDYSKIIFTQIPSNDTWARDHGGITLVKEGRMKVCNFIFNGWGQKFASDKDNQITPEMVKKNLFSPEVDVVDIPFVLEGGSVEFNTRGELLSTYNCLNAPNRNNHFSGKQVEEILTKIFNLKKVHWLYNGDLIGDDTDGHIDTLARFCDDTTIAYVKCDDEKDDHYQWLKAMEDDLKALRDIDGKPFNLVPLPMPDAVFDENDERIPATYANFLIINGAVLVPTYNQKHDADAIAVLQKVFKDREVIGVDCQTLIRQHGSLHCVTMQYPEGVLNESGKAIPSTAKKKEWDSKDVFPEFEMCSNL